MTTQAATVAPPVCPGSRIIGTRQRAWGGGPNDEDMMASRRGSGRCIGLGAFITNVLLPVFVAAAILSLSVPRSSHAQTTFDALCTQVASVAGAEPSVTTGVVVLDLETGDRCSINGDRSYRSASLYKLVVLAELYRQVDEGLVSLEQPLVVEPRHAIDDAPDFRITAPYTITVYGAAERMITFSDNATAFALRELLGLATVNQATEWLGMPATSLGAVFLTSPNDQAWFFEQLYRGELVHEEASASMMDLLLRQVIVDMIPRGLPVDVPVAHKTGTLATFMHDAGVVFAPGGDFVLVAMTENNSLVTAMEVIQEVARVTYAAYENPRVVEAPVLEIEPVAPVVTAPALVAETTPVAPPAPPPMVLLDESTSSASLFDSFRDPLVLGVLVALVLIALVGPAVMLRRRPSVHYGDNVLAPQDARLQADRSERGLVMRFGSRRDDDGRPANVSPASHSVAEVAEQPVLPSRRLQRVAEHFHAQSELLATMRDQFEEEMEPLHELIVRQAQSMQALLQNLEERLRPLNEYADGEEANLTALEERIQAGGQDHVARSFSAYLEEQRQRIEETREQIDQQRMPFLDYGEAQRETVETALQRFDGDIEALEQNLAEQRRVMVRMLDAMRSETFTAVKDYLDGRQSALAELAAAGSTDPVEISRATQSLRADLQALAGKSDHVRALLERAEAGDRALSQAVPSPRPIRDDLGAESDTSAEDDEVDDEKTEATA